MLLGGLVIDYFRYVTVLVAIATAIVVSAVGVIHWRMWHESRDQWYGAKPQHVWEMSLGYLIALIGMCAYTLSLLHHPFRWFATPLLLASCVVVLHAMWKMLTYLGHARPYYDQQQRGPNEEPFSEAARMRLLLKGLSIVAIPVAFIALLPALVGFWRTQQAFDRINRERAARAIAVTHTNEEICRKVNRSNAILAELLRKIAARGRLDQSLAQEFASALVRLRPQNCKKLPSSVPLNKPH